MGCLICNDFLVFKNESYCWKQNIEGSQQRARLLIKSHMIIAIHTPMITKYLQIF